MRLTNDDIKKRTTRYWFIDGLADIAVGVIFVVLALFYLALALSRPGKASMWIIGIGQPLLMIALFFATGRAVRYFKARITFPRTGYVSYRKKPRPYHWTRMLLIAVLVAVTVFLVVWSSSLFNAGNVIILTGMFTGFFFAAIGYQSNLTRFYLLGALALLMGLGIAWLGLPVGSWSNTALLGGIGLSLLVSGGVTLWHYLRTTVQVSDAQEEPPGQPADPLEGDR